jgi:glycosyltransferase involved in cell wall biosynthesis
METEKKLSVVYVIPSSEISGGIYVACEHAMRLRERGHRVMFAVMRRSNRRLEWFPDCDIPIIGIGDIPRDVDALIATWWETAYAIAEIPARAKFFLVQSIENRFYNKEHGAEAILSSRAYHFGYHVISVASWLAQWLEATYKKKVCLVQNQLNSDLFYPVERLSPVLSSLTYPKAYLYLRVRSQNPTYVQVFWDDGGGFSEPKSALFDVTSCWGEKCIQIKPLSSLRKIRIDAGAIPDNIVEFSLLELVSDKGIGISLLNENHWAKNDDVASCEFSNGILSVGSCGNDPYISYPIGREALRCTEKSIPDGIRILVEGPIGIDFKGVKEALDIAIKAGCEVWFVEGKNKAPVLDRFCAHRIFGCVPIDKMKYIYSSCDILLKLSRVESFAYPPLEMMACGGIPVVGDVEGIHEYMIDGYNGFIVNPSDGHGIVKLLERLINDGELRDRIKRGCRETVAKYSCWEKQIDALERFLCEKTAPVQDGACKKDQTFVLTRRELIELYNGLARYRDDPKRYFSREQVTSHSV